MGYLGFSPEVMGNMFDPKDVLGAFMVNMGNVGLFLEVMGNISDRAVMEHSFCLLLIHLKKGKKILKYRLCDKVISER